MQAPAWQESLWVQASPSVQAVPFGLSGLEQAPLAGSQTPARSEERSVGKTRGFGPAQAPAWKESLWVQASPSVQAVPFGLSGLEQVPFVGSQTPAMWH